MVSQVAGKIHTGYGPNAPKKEGLTKGLGRDNDSMMVNNPLTRPYFPGVVALDSGCLGKKRGFFSILPSYVRVTIIHSTTPNPESLEVWECYAFPQVHGNPMQPGGVPGESPYS